MIERFVNHHPQGRLTYQQTSLLEVITAAEVHQIDFVGKVAARLKRGTYGALAYSTQHPALVYHNASLRFLTVRTTIELPVAFLLRPRQPVHHDHVTLP